MATDVACVQDLDLSGAIVTGDSELAQRVYGRITTARGTLIDDDSYGILTAAYLGKPNIADKYAIDAEIEIHRELGAESARVFVTSQNGNIATIQVQLGQKTIAIPALLGSSSYVVPTITSISPASGSSGGGQLVVITGTGFDGVTAVGLTPATTPISYFGRVDSATIHAIIGGGMPGTYAINVTTPGGTATLPAAYTAGSSATVTSVFPDVGSNASGQAITLYGTGFTVGQSVSIGGVACTSVAFVSSTVITAVTGAMTAGSLTAMVGSSTLTNAYVALELAGATVWNLYQAANNTLSGSTITALIDQGPAANNAINGAGNKPTINVSNALYNNRKTAHFPVYNTYLQTAGFSNAGPITQFIVGNTIGSDPGNNTQTLIDGITSPMSLSYYSTVPLVEMYCGGAIDLAASVIANIKHVWTQVFDGTSSYFSASSNTETSGTTAITSGGGITIGCARVFDYGCEGDIGLVLQIQGRLSKAQRDTNRALLGAYYGKIIT